MMNRKIFSSLQLVHASVVIACVGVRKKRGLANLRLTVGSRSLRSISRPCFFSIFSNFFVVFRFWKKNYKRNFGERKFFDEKFWRPKKISSKKKESGKKFQEKKLESRKNSRFFLYH